MCRPGITQGTAALQLSCRELDTQCLQHNNMAVMAAMLLLVYKVAVLQEARALRQPWYMLETSPQNQLSKRSKTGQFAVGQAP